MIKVPWPKIILAVTLLVTAIGALFSTKILTDINKNIAAAKEAARPANIKIVKITTPDCADCFDVDSAISSFKKLNIKVEDEKTMTFDSPEAQASIKQFGIKKVPTYLVTGEVIKNNLENFVKNNGDIKDDTFIFTKLSPVFIDLKTKKEVGRVTVIYLVDSACTSCYDPVKIQKPILSQGFGVKLQDERTLDISSGEGRKLVTKYKITKVPTILLSPDADQYDRLKNVWGSVGTVEPDGWYIFTGFNQLGNITYKDLTNNQVIKPAQK